MSTPKRQRFIHLDYESYTAGDDDTLFLCLSRHQLAYVSSVVSHFRPSFHWGEHWVAGQKLHDRTLGSLSMAMCCEDLQDCLRAMVAQEVRPLLDAQTTQLLDKLRDLYDELGEAGIAPNLISGTQAHIDLAICNALQIIMHTVAEAERQRRDNYVETALQIGEIATNVGIALAILFPVTAAVLAVPTVAAVIVAASAGVAGAIGLFNQILDSTIQNDDYISSLACCAYGNMQGSAPTFTSFRQSLSGGCGFVGDLILLATAFDEILDSLDMYLLLLDTAEQLYPYIENGYIDSCVCVDEWIYVADFLISDEGFVRLAGNGSWAQGTGWSNNPNGSDALVIGYDCSEFQLLELTVEFDGTTGLVEPDGGQFVSNFDGTAEQSIGRHDETEHTYTINRWLVGFRLNYNPSPGDSQLMSNLIKLTFKGKGYNPFA